jgi:hypothetical protein
LQWKKKVEARMSESENSNTKAENTAVDSGPRKAVLKKFRLMHRREDFKSWPIILQNRTVEAESAHKALQSALNFMGDSAPYIHTLDESAWAIKTFAKYVDFWEIDLE